MSRLLPADDDDRACPSRGAPGAESLLTNAVDAQRLAATMCTSDADSICGCAWYHGFYPALRLFGLAATPERHAAFFTAALGATARSHSRVVISGAADGAMLAHVLRAYAAQAAMADVTALDACATPLVLGARAAQRWSVPLTTVRADVVGWAPPARFDVLCTHSFLAQFPPRERAAVFRTWSDVLRPGGKLVTTMRVDTAPSAGPVRAAAQSVRRFRDAVLDAAESWRERLGLDRETLARRAEQYAERTVTYALTRDELLALLDQYGFAVDQLTLREIDGSVGANGGIAGTSRRATYAELVATRA